MNIKDMALKNILKNKLNAEQTAEQNLETILKNDNIKALFLKCKRLVVVIAKKEVDGLDATEDRNEYNKCREKLAKILSKMGIDKAILKPKYSCLECKDTGYIGNQMCSCLKSEISKKLVELAGLDISAMPKIPTDYSIYESPDKIKELYDNMQKFVDSIDKTQVDTILIVGDTGVGKTYMLQAIAKYGIDQGHTVKYSTAFSFNQEMLKYHCAKLEEKDDIIDYYLNCDMLFLDDLGSENKINNVTNEYMYLVLNERMQHHKKTIISTNLDFKQIQDSYGERVFSRLMHKKYSLKFKFPGSDLRIKGV